jgi:hypothetical protein
LTFSSPLQVCVCVCVCVHKHTQLTCPIQPTHMFALVRALLRTLTFFLSLPPSPHPPLPPQRAEPGASMQPSNPITPEEITLADSQDPCVASPLAALTDTSLIRTILCVSACVFACVCARAFACMFGHLPPHGAEGGKRGALTCWLHVQRGLCSRGP